MREAMDWESLLKFPPLDGRHSAPHMCRNFFPGVESVAETWFGLARGWIGLAARHRNELHARAAIGNQEPYGQENITLFRSILDWGLLVLVSPSSRSLELPPVSHRSVVRSDGG